MWLVGWWSGGQVSGAVAEIVFAEFVFFRSCNLPLVGQPTKTSTIQFSWNLNSKKFEFPSTNDHVNPAFVPTM